MKPLDPGAQAPPIPGVEFTDGPVALFFYKVTCPTCQMAAPVAERVAVTHPEKLVGVVQDPPERADAFAQEYRTTFPSVTDVEPYDVSNAYGVRVVPTLFVIEREKVVDVVESWDRDGWNRVSAYLGSSTGSSSEPVSTEGDGLPPFRPG
ncbi:MAG TPA: redoxin domain-containing protein [Actinomycetota bacterium]|nr:redoxin domain-containing protein [Actinomycetota bacterium]